MPEGIQLFLRHSPRGKGLLQALRLPQPVQLEQTEVFPLPAVGEQIPGGPLKNDSVWLRQPPALPFAVIISKGNKPVFPDGRLQQIKLDGKAVFIIRSQIDINCFLRLRVFSGKHPQFFLQPFGQGRRHHTVKPPDPCNQSIPFLFRQQGCIYFKARRKGYPAAIALFRHHRYSCLAQDIQIPADGPAGYLKLFCQFRGSDLLPLQQDGQDADQSFRLYKNHRPLAVFCIIP